MLDMLTNELQSKGALNTNNLPDVITMVADALPKVEITDKMRLAAAQSEVMLFAGMLRRNMILWDDTSVPINGITFLISESGAGKDRTAKGVRKCFDKGYELIGEKRTALAKQRAIETASAEGSDDPNDPSEWEKYYHEPESLFSAASSTVKGLHGHFNRLEDENLGAGYITSMEIGSALESGPQINELIEFLSEVYDTGNKEVKLIGNKEEQLHPLINFPVTALFGGSQVNLLYDEGIKKKFKMQFSSKLARRSTFNFNPTTPSIPKFNSIPALNEYKTSATEAAKEAREQAIEGIMHVADYHLSAESGPMMVSAEVEQLFNVYMEYNKLQSQAISRLYPMSVIARQHQQWRALKLAGALAIFALHDEVTIQDYVQAINFCEVMSTDLELFEVELEKEPYEVFADYIKTKATDGKAKMSIHHMRKMGYIQNNNSKAKLNELVLNASSYDPDGIYTVCEGGVCYEFIEKTPINGVSYLPVSGSKEQRAKQCASGFEYNETTFDQLADMLKGDFAYSPFEFKNGQRAKANVISGAKWLALDVDDSKVTASEMHYILQDLNHHIALTSDSTNEFKFRLLVELDSFVDIDDKAWKFFTQSIGEELNIIIDNLPKSQIFFSYGAEEVYSVIDKEPLETKEHVMFALSQAQSPTTERKLTNTEKSNALADPMETFARAYEAPHGKGTRNMIWAAYEANNLGASKEEITELLHDINEYWLHSMPTERFQNTILSVVDRL